MRQVFFFFFLDFYILPHDSGRVLWFHVGGPCVCLSIRQSYVRPSVFSFRMITWVNVNGYSANLVCALILWRSGLGLQMGKFRKILTELSARDTPIFSFPDDNLSKHKWIFTKLGMCIDIVESFVCVEVLRPSQPSGVMSSAVSLPNHTFTGQA